MAIPLGILLSKVPEDTEERVDRVRKQIQASIRSELRQETGFLLNRKDSTHQKQQKQDAVAVPVELVAGLPARLERFEFPDDLELALEISPYRRELSKIADGIDGCLDRGLRFPHTTKGTSFQKKWDKLIRPTDDLIKSMLALVSKKDPLDMLLGVNEDVLGAYFYKVHQQLFFDPIDPTDGRIELYWGVIGLIAGMLGVPLDLLTKIVLIHELAHAYTHVGADIDGKRWESTSFSEASHELKEGLAQYYTHIITHRLNDQHRNLHDVFLLLLSHQPKAYHTHESWIAEYRPEEVRSAMISVRRAGNGDLKFFTSELRAARKRLRTS